MRLSLRSPALKGLIGALAAFGGASAWAGGAFGSVSYGPGAQSVPLLSDLMVLMLVALVAALAYRALRSGAAGRPLASIVALGIAVAGGVLSGRLESVVEAAIPTVNLTSASGGTVTLTSGGETRVTNQTAAPQQIQNVQATGVGNSVGNPVGTPKCQAGSTVLQPAGSCYVFIIVG